MKAAQGHPPAPSRPETGAPAIGAVRSLFARRSAGGLLWTGGFSRLDLLALVAGLGLLAVAAAPGLANPRMRADLAVCLNNLRQIVRAFHVWAADHEETLPWRYPYAKGGTQGAPLDSQSWYQFSTISNELATPRLLHDPADKQKRTADTWTALPEGGLLHANYRNNAISYALGLDASLLRTVSGASTTDFALAAQHVLVIDRHTEVNQVGVSCSSGVRNAAGVIARPMPNVGWKETNPAIHGSEMGNVGVLDGSVHQVNRAGLNRLYSTGDDNGTVHLLFP